MSRTLPRRRASLERGLTLIEMLIVLVILAAVATVAVTATDGVASQARWDGTERSLGAIEEAIVGPQGQRAPDGVPLVTGFVADMGRLPVVENAAGGDGRRLQELWIQDTRPSFAISAPAGDPDVRVPGGWRGPYVRLPVGADVLTDGWGRAVLPLDDATGAVATTDGTAIGGVGTLGADGAVAGVAYDADLALTFARAAAPIVRRHAGSLSVRVKATSPSVGDRIVVRVYGPVNGVVRTIAQQDVAVADETPVALPSLFEISVGPRVVRAYQVSALPASAEDPITASYRSVVTRIVMLPGGLPELQLDCE